MTRKFCAVDAEGDAGERGLIGVAFWSDDRQLWATDPAVIEEQLLWHARAGYTFAGHNMEYDLGVIWWQLGYEAKCISFNRVFNHGEWKYQGGRPAAQLWDSLNLAAGLGLAELGEAMQLPKYPMPQRLAGLDPDQFKWRCDRHGTWECVECYALRDAEIVWTYLRHMYATVSGWGGRLHRRVGSTGLSVWQALDQPRPIRLRDRRAAWLGRAAYYGGRVECLQLGHFGPLYSADFSSMYPSVMLETRFPDPAHMVTMAHLAPDRVPWELEGAAHCQVYVPHTWVPPLPNNRNGERIFGTGLQEGHWTFLELRYAMSLGCEVRRVYRASWATESLSPFTWFVSTLWEARRVFRELHDPRELVVKALLNETYGRFALAKDLAEETIRVLEPGEPWSRHKGCRHFEAFGMLMCCSAVPKWFDRAWQNELWAAQITAAARVKLHRALIQQGDALVYCDTDSVMSTRPIIGTGDGLGLLGAETVYERAWIVGPKMYRLEPVMGDPVTKAKGVPRDRADAFLRGDEVYFDRPISPHQMAMGQGQAGAWITLSRERRLVPFRRQPRYPAELETAWGQTATDPPVFGPAGV